MLNKWDHQNFTNNYAKSEWVSFNCPTEIYSIEKKQAMEDSKKEINVTSVSFCLVVALFFFLLIAQVAYPYCYLLYFIEFNNIDR